jgi:hypothetical protein
MLGSKHRPNRDRIAMHRKTLTQFLVEQQRREAALPAQLRLLIEIVARACKAISHSVNKGTLGGMLGDHRLPEYPGRGAEETRRDRQRNPAGGQRVGRPPRRHGVGGDGDHPPHPQPLPARRIPALVRPDRRLEQRRCRSHRRHHLFRPQGAAGGIGPIHLRGRLPAGRAPPGRRGLCHLWPADPARSVGGHRGCTSSGSTGRWAHG